MDKMIILLILTVVVFIASCKNSHKVDSNIESSMVIENFDWLLGNWQRINKEDGKETYEIWKKNNNTEYLGVGYTMQNNDTIWKENIKLIKSVDNWNFEVLGMDGSTPTVFKVTKINNGSFTCENELNEFPKKIKYFKNEDNISAVISGGDTKVLFEFERLNN